MKSTGSIVVDGLFHHYSPGLEVIRDVSLKVPAGGSLALLGPSGCGKTTLLRSIAGLERPSRGSITVGDKPVFGADVWVPPERRRVGMVFQDWALFPHMTVARNVGYGLKRSGRDELTRAALELVGLSELGSRMPSTLSGGQQQRVALARALAPQPVALLLDEPFSNLDTGLRARVRAEVRQLLLDIGTTAIFVTHDQEEAFVLGDQVAVVRDGRIEQIDSPEQLYATPTNRWVAEFIGDVSIVVGEATGQVASTILGTIPLDSPREGPVEVLMRPEQLAIVPGDLATVESVEFYGHDAMVYADVDGQLLRVRTAAEAGTERGKRIGLAFTGQAAHAFEIAV